MNKKLGILILGMLLLGCGNRKINEYQGIYTYGHEVRIFQDKKTDQQYWITGDEKLIKNLDEHMENLVIERKENYPKEKLKIKAIDEGEATNGLAEPGDRKLKVLEYQIIEN